MALFRNERKGKQRHSAKMVPCDTCNADVLPGYVHCDGTGIVFGAFSVHEGDNPWHHGKVSWGECWKCERPLGCSLCVSGMKVNKNGLPYNDEIICKPCRVAANFETFVRGGPLVGCGLTIGYNPLIFEMYKIDKPTPSFKAYPKDWKAKYVAEFIRLYQRMPADSDAQVLDDFRAALKAFGSGTIQHWRGGRENENS